MKRAKTPEADRIKTCHRTIEQLEAQLMRANRIIGWMMPHIGVMCPPDGGLAELNEHCFYNHVPDPKREQCDRPVGQKTAATVMAGSLDDGVPNHLDHSKRGFQPQ